MWQRQESFTKCIINCRSTFKSSILADKLSELRLEEIECAARHILEGRETNNET